MGKKRGVGLGWKAKAEKALSNRTLGKKLKNNFAKTFFPFFTLVIAVTAIGILHMFFPADNALTGATFASNISACGQNTNASNTVYELVQNLTIGGSDPCFEVDEDNTTIDCQNFAILGTGAADSARGVRVIGADDFTLQNCTIEGFGDGRGVQIRSGSDSIVIRNSTFIANEYGIEMFGSDGLVVFNITVNDSKFLYNTHGVRTVITSGTVDNVTILDSLFFENDNGVRVEDAGVTNFTIQGNNFTGGNTSGVNFDDGVFNHTVYRNFFDNNGDATLGILALSEGSVLIDDASGWILLQENNFTHNSSIAGRAVQIRDASDNITVLNNNASNMSVFVHSTATENENVTIVDNIATDSYEYIVNAAGDYWLIINNTFEEISRDNTSLGIQLDFSSNSTIGNNSFLSFVSNSTPLQFIRVNDTNFTNNYIEVTDMDKTTKNAVILVGGTNILFANTNNNLTSNYIDANSTYGIRLIASNLTGVSNNTINSDQDAVDIAISVEFNPSNASLTSNFNTIDSNSLLRSKIGISLNDYAMSNILLNNNITSNKIAINLSRNHTGNHTGNILNTLIQGGNYLTANESILFILGANNTSFLLDAGTALVSPGTPNASIVVDTREKAVNAIQCGGLIVQNLAVENYGIGVFLQNCDDVNVTNSRILGNDGGTTSTNGVVAANGRAHNISNITFNNFNGTGIVWYDVNNSFVQNISYMVMPAGSTWMHLFRSFSNNISNYSGVGGAVGVEIDFFSGFNNVRDCPANGTLSTTQLLLDFFSTNTTYDCEGVIVQDFSANNTMES